MPIVTWFHSIEDPSQAEWIPVLVHPSACRTGVLAKSRIDVLYDPGTCNVPILLLHAFEHRCDPIALHTHIRIQKDIHVCIYVLQCPVVATRKPVVFLEFEYLNTFGHILLQPIDTGVVASIVDHPYSHVAGRVNQHTGEVGLEMV
jgi:hypothetical protein